MSGTVIGEPGTELRDRLLCQLQLQVNLVQNYEADYFVRYSKVLNVKGGTVLETVRDASDTNKVSDIAHETLVNHS